jgi:chemotaxis protein MotA
MYVLVGILLVFGAVCGGYKLEGGAFAVLFQPAELVIISGAALGTLLLGNSSRNVGVLLRTLPRVLGRSEYSHEFYLDSLSMLNALFTFGRSQGHSKLETEIDAPQESEIFRGHARFLKDPFRLSFVCDTLRVFIFAGSDPADLNRLMEDETEGLEMEVRQPANSLLTIAEALPGLGIVAAVLGIILTMGAISGPRTVIGERVAASLVGTFLGILLSYGLLGPLATKLGKMSHSEIQYCEFLRAGVAAYTRGCSPKIAVEFARRTIPTRVRPSFEQFEGARRSAG